MTLALISLGARVDWCDLRGFGGVVGAVGYVAYCASKAALIALTKTAALELAPDGIRVNAICPGGVSTPMNEHEKEGGVIPQTPIGRRADVSEISGAVAFLASDDSSFTTGTEMIIDGGSSPTETPALAGTGRNPGTTCTPQGRSDRVQCEHRAMVDAVRDGGASKLAERFIAHIDGGQDGLRSARARCHRPRCNRRRPGSNLARAAITARSARAG
jgi:hypothetical protein